MFDTELGSAIERRSGADPRTVAVTVCVMLEDVLTNSVDRTVELATSMGKVKLTHALTPAGTRPGIPMLTL